MVVFTCNNCGDSVKKPKVEKHISFECKKKKFAAASLCCIDCLVNFNSDTYAAHTKCFTEEERYSAQGFVPKPSSNKGERKQNLWIDIVRSVLDRTDLNKIQRQLLETISNFENVPRKKIKFQNFIKSAVRNVRVSPPVVDAVFDLLEKEFKNNAPIPVNPTNKKEELCTEAKKNDMENVIENQLNGESSEIQNEDWHGSDGKKKKKKKDKIENEANEAANNIVAGAEVNDDLSVVNVENDNDNSFQVVKKKKKKKKSEENIEVVENIEANTENESNKRSFDEEKMDDNLLNNKQISKKKKKKLKLQMEVNTTFSRNDDFHDFCDNGKENTVVEQDISQPNYVNETSPVDVISNNEESIRPLNKKEKKELKKKLKYENSLKAIELEHNEQMNGPEKIENEETRVEKKEKKRKLIEKNDDVENISIKKTKYSEDMEIKKNEDVQNNSNKFDWEIIVKSLLEKSEDGEISLKKMTKKVVKEYKSTYGDNKTYDEIVKKLNKKLKQLPFAVVFKEKVKLCV